MSGCKPLVSGDVTNQERAEAPQHRPSRRRKIYNRIVSDVLNDNPCPGAESAPRTNNKIYNLLSFVFLPLSPCPFSPGSHWHGERCGRAGQRDEGLVLHAVIRVRIIPDNLRGGCAGSSPRSTQLVFTDNTFIKTSF